jgi:hypothetical protein
VLPLGADVDTAVVKRLLLSGSGLEDGPLDDLPTTFMFVPFSARILSFVMS